MSTAQPHSGNPGVCAVLVTYRPDLSAVHAALAAVRSQVAAVVVVDNGSPGFAAAADGYRAAGAELVAFEHNRGLAAAHNAGIDFARRHGHTHVLLLDQDSVPAPGMVAQLLAALNRLEGSVRVAAVGPRFRDDREERDAPFVRVAFPMSTKLYCTGDHREIECDFLISSGVLIPMAVLDDVGDMDAGIFIDNVDMEWSFRVRAAGYRLFGVCAASMRHRLGDDRSPVLGGRAKVVRHAPVRLYFIMRNRLVLYRRPYTPRVWIAQDVPRVVAKFLIFALLTGPRRRNVRYMVRGLLDGLRNRSGPCPLGGER